jgi:hypothetical protein
MNGRVPSLALLSDFATLPFRVAGVYPSGCQGQPREAPLLLATISEARRFCHLRQHFGWITLDSPHPWLEEFYTQPEKSLPAQKSERNVATVPELHGESDPQHGERLQHSCLLEGAGVKCFEPKLGN